MNLEYYICAILLWLLGCQINNRDFFLLTGKYNYEIGISQCISYFLFIAAVCIAIYSYSTLWTLLAPVLIAFALSFFLEYILSKVNSQSSVFNYIVRFVAVCGIVSILLFCNAYSLLAFIVMGWYTRNTKFGVVHRNTFVLARCFSHSNKTKKKTIQEIVVPEGMPDFSNAGNRLGIIDKQIYNVANYDIKPGTNEDLTDKVQRLINMVGESGGGSIFFPKGRYMFNTKGHKSFLQINHSNIDIHGELDDKGNILSTIVNCGSLVCGSTNPWLSPFFITTGEKLQQSNIFWGLQFRRKKNIVMKSTSMSDPGSDGTILTPPFATRIIKSSPKGSDVLFVEDSAKVGKYIMLGMYNTDKEATLLKDILGQDVIRPEWQAASRAGEEEAPSFQWLIEVKEVIDKHSIKLVQPLWRDCDMRYEPAVFNVDMLENVSIRNLRVSSTWNGLFRHHGHKRYYSVSQAQEMDYGWNAINMKRVAHGNIENVIIDNFTNPLYVMDSRNVTCSDIVIKGNDGHQGIKIYEHACDNLFRNITFYNHFADMLGGEGNAYGNVFSFIYYHNPCFKPVDFDFHGFSEGPMSPPSYNLFENVYGFAYVGSCGSLHMAPSCGRTNVWWNCYCEGEKRGSYLFHQKYSPNPAVSKKVFLKAIFNTFKKACFTKSLSYKEIRNYFDAEKEKCIATKRMTYSEIARFYTDFYLYGMNTTARMELLDRKYIHVMASNKTCSINSLYDYQRSHSSK